MSQYLEIHPTHPQDRYIQRVIAVLNKGGVIAYPTDSGYALGCHIGDKGALERLRNIRQVDKNHNFTLICRDLTEIALYARVSNMNYRTLRAHTPGPYTFILSATREVPKRLQHPKRKTIGIRVSPHGVTMAILTALGQPIMSSSLILPGEEMPLTDPYIIHEKLQNQLDLTVDSGLCPAQPTTVVDIIEDYPALIRQGGGDIHWINP